MELKRLVYFCEEDWFISAKRTIDGTHKLLENAHDTVVQMTENHKTKLAVEKRGSDSLQAPIADLTCQVAKVEVLLRTSSSKEKTALAEAKTLVTQQRRLLAHLRNFRSKMPGFQARVAEEVEDRFSAFCRKLVPS